MIICYRLLMRNQVIFPLCPLQVEAVEEFLAYTGLDLLNAFGGYLGLFIGASIMSLYDVTIKNFLKILTKFKSSDNMRNEKIHETECNEEFKWNNSITTKTQVDILPEKNQILTKPEQYEEKLFRFENTLNVLSNKVNALENIIHKS